MSSDLPPGTIIAVSDSESDSTSEQDGTLLESLLLERADSAVVVQTRERSNTQLVTDDEYEAVSESSSSGTSSDDDDSSNSSVDAALNESSWTRDQALEQYHASQHKLREAKTTIVSLIEQITEYQSVMEQEKAALETQLHANEAVFAEEKNLMTQLLTEAEQSQERQNAETMQNLTTLMVELENIEEMNNRLNDELAHERKELAQTLEEKAQNDVLIVQLREELKSLKEQSAKEPATAADDAATSDTNNTENASPAAAETAQDTTQDPHDMDVNAENGASEPKTPKRPSLKRPASYSRGLASLAGHASTEAPQLHHSPRSAAAVSLEEFLVLPRSEQQRLYNSLNATSKRMSSVAPLVQRLAAAFGTTATTNAVDSPAPGLFANSSVADLTPTAKSTAQAAAGLAARQRLSNTLAHHRHGSLRRTKTPTEFEPLAAMEESAPSAASATIENMREMLQRERQTRNAGLATLRAIPKRAEERMTLNFGSTSRRGTPTRPGMRRGRGRAVSSVYASENNVLSDEKLSPIRENDEAVMERRGSGSVMTEQDGEEVLMDWYEVAEMTSAVTSIVSTSHKTVIVGDSSGEIRIYEADAANRIADAFAQLEDDAPFPPLPPAKQQWNAHPKGVTAVLSVGSKIWSASKDGTVSVWSSSGRLITTLTKHKSQVTALASIPKQRQVWTAGADMHINVWDAKSFKLIKSIKCDNYVVSLGVHNDEVWVGTESIIIAYHVKTFIRLLTLKAHTKLVHCIRSVSDDKIWSCSADATICVWTSSGQLVKQWERPAAVLWLNAIEQHVWVGHRDGSVAVFDKETYECLHRLDDVHSGSVVALSSAPMPGSNRVAMWSGSADRSVVAFHTQYHYDTTTGTISRLADADPKAHDWLKVKFKSATVCKKCKHDIWSLVGGRTGYVCRKCKIAVHKKCFKTVDECSVRRLAGSHVSRKSSHHRPGSPKTAKAPKKGLVRGSSLSKYAKPGVAQNPDEADGMGRVRELSKPVTRRRSSSNPIRELAGLPAIQAIAAESARNSHQVGNSRARRSPRPIEAQQNENAAAEETEPDNESDEFSKLIDQAANDAVTDLDQGKSVAEDVWSLTESGSKSNNAKTKKMNRLTAVFKKSSSIRGGLKEDKKASTLKYERSASVQTNLDRNRRMGSETDLKRRGLDSSDEKLLASTSHSSVVLCERCKKNKARARVSVGTMSKKLCRKCTEEVTGKRGSRRSKNNRSNAAASNETDETERGTL